MLQDLAQFLTDPADKNVVFALLRRLRAELSSRDPEPCGQPEGASRQQMDASHEDLLDLDEHDGDLLEVGTCGGPAGDACARGDLGAIAMHPHTQGRGCVVAYLA